MLLLRCVLDPFDNPYYHLPFLFAFLAWEGSLTVRGVASSSRCSSPVAFLLQTRLAGRVHSDPRLHDALRRSYLAWSLPLLAFMAVHLYSPAAGAGCAIGSTRALPSPAATRSELAADCRPGPAHAA